VDALEERKSFVPSFLQPDIIWGLGRGEGGEEKKQEQKCPDRIMKQIPPNRRQILQPFHQIQ
jgi:hypothetical protein